MKIYFVSKDANWQKYRLDVLSKLGGNYDHSIEILTTGKIKEYLSDNCSVKYKSFLSIIPSRLKVSFMPGILWYIIRNRPDAVLALNNITYITEYCALILCKILKIKFIWWTHAYDHKKKSNVFLSKLREKYTLFFLKKSNSIITFSQKGYDYLVSKGISDKKITVAKNTLDTDSVLETKNLFLSKREEIKKDFGFKTTDKILIFTGRLTKDKKVDHAIKAVHELMEDFKDNLKLVIIGDGEEFKSLNELATKLNLKNISFLGEIYDETVLAQWLLISDLYVMPAYVGLGIIHAFCYGLPFITEEDENHGPEIQYLKNGINGYIVDKNDISSLKNRIKLLISNSEKLQEFSKQAYNTVLNEGNIQLMVENMNKSISVN